MSSSHVVDFVTHVSACDYTVDHTVERSESLSNAPFGCCACVLLPVWRVRVVLTSNRSNGTVQHSVSIPHSLVQYGTMIVQQGINTANLTRFIHSFIVFLRNQLSYCIIVCSIMRV